MILTINVAGCDLVISNTLIVFHCKKEIVEYLNECVSHNQLFLNFSEDVPGGKVSVLFPKKMQLCQFGLVSAGLPGEKCKPCKGWRGQAEGQVPWSGPEARWNRLPHEETTERGRWLRFVHDLVEHKNSGEAGVCLNKNWNNNNNRIKTEILYTHTCLNMNCVRKC